MTVPEGFLFSQSSLQDYVDCQRRFQLRHLLHLAWPAVEVEQYRENEIRIDEGAQFHKIIRQFLLGIPEEQIGKAVEADELMHQWWNNFLIAIKSGSLGEVTLQDSQHYEEITLSIPFLNFRLIAKYDLLVIQPNRKITIYDWKTSQNHPQRRWLADRLQTHIYPFVLAEAYHIFDMETTPGPDEVQMIYWFSNQPDQPESFSYTQHSYAEDREYLTNLITNISQKTEPIYPLTPVLKRCLFCTYRSLCNRGVKPGELQQLDDWQEPASAEEVSIDIDQIGEIEL